VAELKRELAMHDQLSQRSSVRYEPFTEEQRDALKDDVRGYLAGEAGADELAVTSLRHVRELFAQFKALHHEQAAELERAAATAAAAARAPPRAVPQAAAGGGFGGEGGGGGGEGGEGDMPPVEVVEFVGDVSAGGGDGFSCGEAPDASRPAVPVSQLVPSRPSRPSTEAAARTGSAAAAGGGGVGGGGGGPLGGAGAGGAGLAPGMSGADVEKVRAKAFETFKGGPGRELAGLLSEHKAGLRDKRALLRKLGTEVNATKHQIDELKELLERKQELRVAGADVGGGGGGGGGSGGGGGGGGGARTVNEGGEEVDVIDEEEFAWLTQLKAAKARYRAAFESLREARGDGEYVGQLVESTRQQLLADFDGWLALEMPEVAAAAAASGEPLGGSGGGGGTRGSDRGGDPSFGGFGGGGGYGGGGGGFGGGSPGGPGSLGDGPRDQEEEFEAMQTEKILQADPDSLAFVRAAKGARPNAKGARRPRKG